MIKPLTFSNIYTILNIVAPYVQAIDITNTTDCNLNKKIIKDDTHNSNPRNYYRLSTIASLERGYNDVILIERAVSNMTMFTIVALHSHRKITF